MESTSSIQSWSLGFDVSFYSYDVPSEKRQLLGSPATKVDSAQVDVAAHLTSGSDVTLDPSEALRIKRRIDWHLLPLMCAMYLMQFVDRMALQRSVTLGLVEAAQLSDSELDSLVSIFFVGFLVFQFPQALVLQKFHIGKWMSINIFIWSIAILAHAACKSYIALFALRFVLGASQGAVPAGFMIVNTAFYTRQEQPLRVGYWFSMSGLAVVVLELLSFGVSHINSATLESWQLLMIIIAIITFILSILFWFLFPDSTANAWFLTPEDRRLAVLRIKINQMGVGNKRFKWPQLLEVFIEPKTWLFSAVTLLTQIPAGSIATQRQPILDLFNFDYIQTTLINSVEGIVAVASIISAVKFAVHLNNNRAYAATLWALPAIAGGLVVSALPISNRIGLLAAYWTSFWGSASFPVLLGWMGSVTAGHTKRVLTNATVLSAYAIGNIAGPFIWRATEGRGVRIRVPWVVIVACELAFAAAFLVIRLYLSRENSRRDREIKDERYDRVYVVKSNAKGVMSQKLVDKAFLDLTDRQNREFRYVL